jgi:hypothetical protein
MLNQTGSTIGKSRTHGFGKSERKTIENFHSKNSKTLFQEPGPGNYSVNDGIASMRSANTGRFGKDKRMADERVMSPGPGA